MDKSEIFLLVGSTVGYALAVIFGVSVYLLMKQFGIVSPWATILAAALIGLLWMLLPDMFLGRENGTFRFSAEGCLAIDNNVRTACGYRLLAEQTFACAAAGGFAGLVFWIVYAGGWRIKQGD